MISHWVVDLLKSDFVQKICIISNAHFYNQFEQWYNQLEEKSRIVLLNDGSTSNETRLGAGKDNFKLHYFGRFVAPLFALDRMKKHLVKYGQYDIALGMKIELCLYSCRSDPQTLLK